MNKFYFGALTSCACRSTPKLLGTCSLTFEILFHFSFDTIILWSLMVVFCAYNNSAYAFLAIAWKDKLNIGIMIYHEPHAY